MSMGKEFQRVGAATEKCGFFSISQTKPRFETEAWDNLEMDHTCFNKLINSVKGALDKEIWIWSVKPNCHQMFQQLMKHKSRFCII